MLSIKIEPPFASKKMPANSPPPKPLAVIKAGSSGGPAKLPSAPSGLIEASFSGDARRVHDLLLEGAPVDDQLDHLQRTPLIHACEGDHFDVVRLLVGYEADVNRVDARGQTALHAACRHALGNKDVMAYLVRRGADVTRRDSAGNSLLHAAAEGNNLEGIEFCLERRGVVDVNAVNLCGQTPLLLAARVCKDRFLLEYLVNEGADVGVRDYMGSSFLHDAAYYGNPVAARFALDHGLKVGDRDYSERGLNALDCVAEAEAGNHDGAANAPNAAERTLLANLLRDAYELELPRCSFCLEAAAHIQFAPCRHRNSCAGCCVRWKRCNCGAEIAVKADVLTAKHGAVEEPAEDFGEEARRLKEEKKRLAQDITCAVCLDAPKKVVFDACGHGTCQKCSISLTWCHLCRTRIRKKIKFY